MFTHLHVASAYSGHYGVTRPEYLVEAAVAAGASALAITDRNGLYGAVKHIGACLKVGISPIVGVEIALLGDEGVAGHVTVLAHGRNGGVGWKALCAVVSEAQRFAKKQAVGLSIEKLAELVQAGSEESGFSSVCTVMLGTDCSFAVSAMNGSKSLALEQLSYVSSLFVAPGSLAVEVVSHLTEPGTTNSSLHAGRLVDLADAVGVPAVLTNAVRYLSPDDA
ncbi:MAG: hypothetical protein RL556_298, partial [Actinomycetota bacterium]